MISLIRTQLLVVLNLNSFTRGTKRAKILVPAVIVLLALSPSYIGFIVLLNKLFAGAKMYGVPSDMILTAAYGLSQVMVLLLGVPIVFSTLFRSKDLSILLPLPFTPWQIIAAKLTVAYVMELVFSLLFILPAFVLNIQYNHPSVLQIANGTLCLLLLPVIPLAICGVISILVVNIPHIGTSRWFWQLAIVAAIVSVSMVMSALSTGSVMNSVDWAQVKIRQMNQTGRIIPGAVFGLKAFASSGAGAVLYQILNLTVVAAYIGALFLVARRLYLAPVLRGDGIRRRKSRRRMRPLRQRSYVVSAAGKELAHTLKDPSVAINGVGAYIMIPILLITYTVIKIQSHGRMDVIGSLVHAANSSFISGVIPLVTVGVALVLTFMASSSSLFAASYSKDGKRLWIEKSLPVDPFTVLQAKLLAGMMLVTTLNLATILALSLVLPISFLHWVYVFVLSEIIIAFNAVIGLLIDCRRPKVEWKDTVQAVKQNLNVVLSLAVTMCWMLVNFLVLYICRESGAPAVVLYGLVLGMNAFALAVVLALARGLSQGLRDVIV